MQGDTFYVFCCKVSRNLFNVVAENDATTDP